MTTQPNYPTVIASANVATYMQFKKDNGHDLTAELLCIKETGEIAIAVVTAGVTYICGHEYYLPTQTMAAPPYSANTTDGLVFALPQDCAVLLDTLDITCRVATTLDGSHYWSVAMTGYKPSGTTSPVSFDLSLAGPDADYPLSISVLVPRLLPLNSTRVGLSFTKTSTPGNLSVWAGLRARNILATLT